MQRIPRRPQVNDVLVCRNGRDFEPGPSPGGGGGGVAPASRYQAGGADPIALDTLAVPTDITTLNASTTKHGLMPKLGNDPNKFFNGQGNQVALPSTLHRCVQNIPQSIPAYVNTIIDFQYSDIAVGGGTITTGASWRFTATEAGNYFVHACLGITSTTYAAGDFWNLQLLLNGGIQGYLADLQIQAISVMDLMLNGSDYVPMAIGDYFNVQAMNYNAAAAAINTSGTWGRSHITIEKR